MIKMKTLKSFIKEGVLDNNAGVPDYDIKPAQKFFSDLIMWSKKIRPNVYWIGKDSVNLRHGAASGTFIEDKGAQQGFKKSMENLGAELINDIPSARSAEKEMRDGQCVVVKIVKYDKFKMGVQIYSKDAELVLFNYHHYDKNPHYYSSVNYIYSSRSSIEPCYKLNKVIGDMLIELITTDKSW